MPRLLLWMTPRRLTRWTFGWSTVLKLTTMQSCFSDNTLEHFFFVFFLPFLGTSLNCHFQDAFDISKSAMQPTHPIRWKHNVLLLLALQNLLWEMINLFIYDIFNFIHLWSTQTFPDLIEMVLMKLQTTPDFVDSTSPLFNTWSFWTVAHPSYQAGPCPQLLCLLLRDHVQPG